MHFYLRHCWLLSLPVKVKRTRRVLDRLNQENKLGFKKDTAYRFLNSIHTNWQKFICLLAKTITLKLNPTTSDNRIETLIIDDTIYKRDRSKNVELLSKVYDHNDKRFFRGFRCLTAGYSDGETFIPTGFNLLSSSRRKSRYNEANENIDRRSFGYERREASKDSMLNAAFDLVRVAQQGVISFSHVLFDSWFSFPSFFRKLLSKNVHGIGMLKAMHKIFYNYNDKLYTLSDLYALIADKIPNDKDKFSVVVTFKGAKDTDPMSMKILFIREMSRKRSWLALGTTDLSLSDDDILILYSRRWDIEVFFKTCKVYLGLARECAACSYDALTAEIAICYTRYCILATIARDKADPRFRSTPGDLFYLCFDEIAERSLDEVMKSFYNALLVVLNSDDFNINIECFVSAFISLLPANISACLVNHSCET